ncbi:hypothetical protein VOLCADRAFT_96253 [Volvox carteri f. nagariensis]|uniref:Protein kinase domain-containing protein n=1 Tax=Volvox carteri f. nagariensis TaxID=3068 RepID=D8U9M2_VOLCA|nr:uncharacterized protein VOLCADRAFT_96253 [Volvox carteri f. nagariensis]EFJ43607.1 hypothetical protein VOLCADRAFT_96253 [Volvox carteri f. nagariensis]|eukprot:XP_002955307.1 hypothetical protein VOLCADRAFT_96253 [Volvox carteri f. nagariensis]
MVIQNQATMCYHKRDPRASRHRADEHSQKIAFVQDSPRSLTRQAGHLSSPAEFTRSHGPNTDELCKGPVESITPTAPESYAAVSIASAHGNKAPIYHGIAEVKHRRNAEAGPPPEGLRPPLPSALQQQSRDIHKLSLIQAFLDPKLPSRGCSGPKQRSLDPLLVPHPGGSAPPSRLMRIHTPPTAAAAAVTTRPGSKSHGTKRTTSARKDATIGVNCQIRHVPRLVDATRTHAVPHEMHATFSDTADVCHWTASCGNSPVSGDVRQATNGALGTCSLPADGRAQEPSVRRPTAGLSYNASAGGTGVHTTMAGCTTDCRIMGGDTAMCITAAGDTAVCTTMAGGLSPDPAAAGSYLRKTDHFGAGSGTCSRNAMHAIVCSDSQDTAMFTTMDVGLDPGISARGFLSSGGSGQGLYDAYNPSEGEIVIIDLNTWVMPDMSDESHTRCVWPVVCGRRDGSGNTGECGGGAVTAPIASGPGAAAGAAATTASGGSAATRAAHTRLGVYLRPHEGWAAGGGKDAGGSWDGCAGGEWSCRQGFMLATATAAAGDGEEERENPAASNGILTLLETQPLHDAAAAAAAFPAAAAIACRAHAAPCARGAYALGPTAGSSARCDPTATARPRRSARSSNAVDEVSGEAVAKADTTLTLAGGVSGLTEVGGSSPASGTCPEGTSPTAALLPRSDPASRTASSKWLQGAMEDGLDRSSPAVDAKLFGAIQCAACQMYSCSYSGYDHSSYRGDLNGLLLRSIESYGGTGIVTFRATSPCGKTLTAKVTELPHGMDLSYISFVASSGCGADGAATLAPAPAVVDLPAELPSAVASTAAATIAMATTDAWNTDLDPGIWAGALQSAADIAWLMYLSHPNIARIHLWRNGVYLKPCKATASKDAQTTNTTDAAATTTITTEVTAAAAMAANASFGKASGVLSLRLDIDGDCNRERNGRAPVDGAGTVATVGQSAGADVSVAADAAADADTNATTGTSSPVCLVLVTSCDLGSLRTALDKGLFGRHRACGEPARSARVVDWKAILHTLLDVARALRYLHGKHIVHRSLQPDAVQLYSNGSDPRGFTAKLAEFGLAVRLHPHPQQQKSEPLASHGKTRFEREEQRQQQQQGRGEASERTSAIGPLHSIPPEAFQGTVVM